MAVLPNNEPTEKRIVETTPDGTVVSSQPLPQGEPAVQVQPVAQMQPVQPVQTPPPQVIRVKSGGNAGMYVFLAIVVLAAAGIGVYFLQNNQNAVALQREQLENQQKQAAMQQRLEQIGQKAESLGNDVRSAQQDIAAQPSSGLSASSPAPAVSPAPASPAPVAPPQQH